MAFNTPASASSKEKALEFNKGLGISADVIDTFYKPLSTEALKREPIRDLPKTPKEKNFAKAHLYAAAQIDLATYQLTLTAKKICRNTGYLDHLPTLNANTDIYQNMFRNIPRMDTIPGGYVQSGVAVNQRIHDLLMLESGLLSNTEGKSINLTQTMDYVISKYSLDVSTRSQIIETFVREYKRVATEKGITPLQINPNMPSRLKQTLTQEPERFTGDSNGKDSLLLVYQQETLLRLLDNPSTADTVSEAELLGAITCLYVASKIH